MKNVETALNLMFAARAAEGSQRKFYSENFGFALANLSTTEKALFVELAGI